MTLNIAIVGAGPAGCMLARLLQVSRQDISVTIFEYESSLNVRSQGGSLDLHTKTGQAALKAGGLYDDFLKHARFDGEAVKLADKNLLCYISQGPKKEGSTTGRPEIDRPVLRQLLYDGLDPDTVTWNSKLDHISLVEEDRGSWTLHFTNGSTASGFDLVVGADGAWSKVRPSLSSAKPFYSGIGGHSFTILDAQHQHPDLCELVNRGSLFSWSDGKSIMAQQMGDGSLNVSTWAVRHPDWQTTSGYDVHDAKAVKEACRQAYADWDARLVAFMQEAEDHVVPRDLYMLPIGHRWEHKPGVTLIGDSAHLMTPFAGEGVNLAFQDALNLSKAILRAAAKTSSSSVAPTLDAEVAAFEEDMFIRAKATQQMTWDMMSATFMSPGALRTGIERYILTAVQGELGCWPTKILGAPLVYAYFFAFKLIHRKNR